MLIWTGPHANMWEVEGRNHLDGLMNCSRLLPKLLLGVLHELCLTLHVPTCYHSTERWLPRLPYTSFRTASAGGLQDTLLGDTSRFRLVCFPFIVRN